MSLKVKQTLYTPRQALRVPGGCGSQISRQSTHESSQIDSPKHWPYSPPRKYSWYSFVRQCGRKDYVNEKFQWHHRESNPRSFGLLHSVSSNCATARPPCALSCSPLHHPRFRFPSCRYFLLPRMLKTQRPWYSHLTVLWNRNKFFSSPLHHSSLSLLFNLLIFLISLIRKKYSAERIQNTHRWTFHLSGWQTCEPSHT